MQTTREAGSGLGAPSAHLFQPRVARLDLPRHLRDLVPNHLATQESNGIQNKHRAMRAEQRQGTYAFRSNLMLHKRHAKRAPLLRVLNGLLQTQARITGGLDCKRRQRSTGSTRARGRWLRTAHCVALVVEVVHDRLEAAKPQRSNAASGVSEHGSINARKAKQAGQESAPVVLLADDVIDRNLDVFKHNVRCVGGPPPCKIRTQSSILSESMEQNILP